jgi:hypothetical protein
MDPLFSLWVGLALDEPMEKQARALPWLLGAGAGLAGYQAYSNPEKFKSHFSNLSKNVNSIFGGKNSNPSQPQNTANPDPGSAQPIPEGTVRHRVEPTFDQKHKNLMENNPNDRFFRDFGPDYMRAMNASGGVDVDALTNTQGAVDIYNATQGFLDNGKIDSSFLSNMKSLEGTEAHQKVIDFLERKDINLPAEMRQAALLDKIKSLTTDQDQTGQLLESLLKNRR